TTIAQLAAASPAGRPKGMAEKTFMNLQAQAALQHRQRQSRANGDGVTCFYDLIDHEPGTGLEALPVPDEGDVFFDMEGDPLYAADHGLEYLFGVYVPADDSYKAFWARSDRDERKAFEGLVDFLEDRRARFPRMHVYHYAPYEKTALCRLMGQYNSRQDVIDAYLRQGVFVDLFAVVRQALRISQPKYSIKMLEPFYGLERKTDVRRGDESIVIFEAWLASGDDALLTDIERYNEDDCRSTYRLREWLLERRRELAGRLRRELPWCVPSEISEAAEEEPSELQQLARRLLDGVPEPLSLAQFRALGGEQRVRWLLGHMLEYHRREEKPAWWKYFERIQNPDQLTEFDSEAIGDLQWRQDIHPLKVSPMDRNLVYTYEFPDQEYNLGASRPWCPHTKSSAGEIRSIDPDARRLQIKLNGKLNPEELRALIPGPPIRNAGQRDAVRRAAEAYERQDLEQQLPAVYDLLIAALPRLSDRTRGTVVQPPQVSAAAISAVVQKLAGGYLFIQGPPGTGKSTKAASVVVDLLDAGKRVGVMSRSHKAIHNLLGKAEKEAARRGTTFRGIYKYSEFAEDSRYQSPLPASMVVNTKDAADVTTAAHDLVAGTAWLFAKVELAQSFDYLFIDEAGQVSLADAVACAQAARNVVLIGDPLQLAQVS
ncbi:TM0106 family RecB-like putative nuclease, partial [bacterium]